MKKKTIPIQNLGGAAFYSAHGVSVWATKGTRNAE